MYKNINMLSEAFNKLLSNWNEPIESELEVISPYQSEPITTEDTNTQIINE